LQMAQLEGDPLQIGPVDGQRRQQFGVAVTRDHLGADRFRRQAQPLGYVSLNRRRGVGVVTDRAAEDGGGDVLAGPLDSLAVAL